MGDSIPTRIGRYAIGNQIGVGGFSRVNIATNDQGQQLCVKIISKKRIARPKDIKHTQDEITALSSLSHPNIVKYHSFQTDENNIYIFMEFCQGKSLLKLINERNGLPDEVCKVIFKQLLETLNFLHENHICHRDIKPENIIVGSDYKIKLIDFGLCAINSEENSNFLLNTFCGSLMYSAPEVIRKENYNGYQSDIWSAGVTLYAMVAARLPWRRP
ncbi:CAMK family protein kinase [Tritrichomonas foetus]|uniref:CAMK family protein kinase n=1 Tax=Tritrichomonas foetus TaxID=1144522 RepID=A0A1J4KF42_9EUKA|nr:CAMK family protein kinase [Tritrichomonas foetus]|eukprot:OHT09795.1 CAMK family protein kinase [Tritrichomonas foetus]